MQILKMLVLVGSWSLGGRAAATAQSQQYRPLSTISLARAEGKDVAVLKTLGGLISDFCNIGDRPKYNDISLSQK